MSGANELDLKDDWSYNNEEEAEMGQLHAIHNNMNAISAVRRQLEKQAAEPSLEECEECGDEIPVARRLAVPGCRLCVFCKERAERK
jgi:phage/conjugal plasmid C-4 type zinc finger TraR family protein